jgi:NADH:ubiquinone oxidoreductase subunit E
MPGRIEIVICLGSSCFARGNKKNLRLIDAYIRDNNLADKVNFHGIHCCSICEKGPVLKIDGQTYEHISPGEIVDVLDKLLKK